MIRLLPKHGTASFTIYLTVWFCIAPILVLCTCTEGHAAYAIQGHEEPACGHQHQEEDHAPATPLEAPANQHDHEDVQVQSDEWLTSNSNLSVLIFSTVFVGVIDAVQGQSSSFRVYGLRNRTHGPPEPLRASISSTILLN